MIQINVITKSIGGATAPSGMVLNINPKIITRKELVDDVVTIKYDVGFDSEIYEDFAAWRASVNSPVLFNSRMVQFPIGYYAVDVPFASLNPAALQALYKDVIENGNDEYTGIGAGNAQVINA